MATTRREFLRVGMVSGLAAAAASLPGMKALAAQKPSGQDYQHAADPAHLTPLEMAHWPKLSIAGKATAGQPFNLMLQIGNTLHPMTTAHHIEWVEVWADGKKVARTDFAEPTQLKPALTVTLVASASMTVTVRTNCNLHGLWENSIKV